MSSIFQVLSRTLRENKVFQEDYPLAIVFPFAPIKYLKYLIRGTQREYSSKPRKHSIVKSILVFKR